MSTSSIRGHGHAGAALLAELQAQQGLHGRRPEPGAQRGQFRGYVFRLTRSPAPPAARRTVSLRSRSPAGARQDPGLQGVETGLPMQAMSALQDEDDDDEERAQRKIQAQTGSQPDLGERGDRDDEQTRQARRLVRLRWALGRGTPDGPGPAAWLRGSSLPGVDALWSRATTAAAALRAAVQALLAARSAAAAGAPGGSVGLVLAIQKQHLQGALQRGPDPVPATLAGIKQVLMELSGPAGKAARTAPLSEAQEDANLLMPVRALNLQRPRTRKQMLSAMNRQDLLAAGLRPAAQQPAVQAQAGAPAAAAPGGRHEL
jgi:hypothetical protein